MTGVIKCDIVVCDYAKVGTYDAENKTTENFDTEKQSMINEEQSCTVAHLSSRSEPKSSIHTLSLHVQPAQDPKVFNRILRILNQTPRMRARYGR